MTKAEAAEAVKAVARMQSLKELMYDLLWEMCDCDDKIYTEACSGNRYPSESAEKLHNIAIRMDGLSQSWEQKVRELSADVKPEGQER